MHGRDGESFQYDRVMVCKAFSYDCARRTDNELMEKLINIAIVILLIVTIFLAIVTGKLGLQPALGKLIRGQASCPTSKAMVHSRSP